MIWDYWQTSATVLIILAAAAYLVRHVYRGITRSEKSEIQGCGTGCEKCPLHPLPDASRARPSRPATPRG